MESPKPYQGQTSQARVHRRVGRACEYCRKKRLKCTPGQRPCFNCQLYDADCVYTERKKRGRVANTNESRNAQQRHGTQGQNNERSHDQDAQSTQLSDAGDSAASDHVGNSKPPAEAESVLVTPPPNVINETLDLDFDSLSTVDFPPNSSLPDPTCPPVDQAEYTSLLQYLEMEAPMDFSDLDAHVGAYDLSSLETNIIGLQQPSPPFVDTTTTGIFSLFGDSNESATRPGIPLGLFIGKDLRANSFIGLHSAGSTLAICLKDCLANSPSLGKFDHIRFLFDAGPHINQSNVPGIDSSLTMELPDKQLADFGIQGRIERVITVTTDMMNAPKKDTDSAHRSTAYFEHIHPIYPIIDRQLFLDNWQSIYIGDISKLDETTFSALSLVVAIGVLSDPSGRGTKDLEEPVLKLYWQAWTFLDKVIGMPYIQSVQVLLLHVILQVQLGRESIAWVLCGLASRIAQSLGLHRPSPIRFNLTDRGISLRSHLWWVTFSLDAFLSTVEGRPTSLSHTMIDHDPLPLRSRDLPPNRNGSIIASIFPWNLKLAIIRHQYCAIIHRSETVRFRLEALAALDSTLVRWHEEVPVEIRPGQAILVPKTASRFVGLLHLEYFLTMCTIHWAMMLSTSKNPEIRSCHDNLRIQASESICVSAARSFIDVLNSFANEHETTRLFPVTLHTHSCVIILSVLYRHIMTNPHRITSRGDLEHFRAGNIHLERHMHPRKLSQALRGLLEEMVRLADRMMENTVIP